MAASPAGGWSGRWSPCPLVLPPVVGGVALLLVFGRRGLVGEWLDATFGFSLPFTTAGVVMAEAFVAMPFLVISVEGALRGADSRYEEAAATLGASRWTAFRRVTLPLIAPGRRGRRGALLGPGARRVRGDDHLRGQLPRAYADHAARRLPGPGAGSGRGDRAQPGAAGRLGGHPGGAARPWLGRDMSLDAHLVVPAARLHAGPRA